MKTKIKLPVLSICLGAILLIGFAGSISGTLAWWAYSTRASIGYYGTSVASSEQLQIGIKTTLDMSSYGMTKVVVGDDPDTQAIEGDTYYFCDAGTGLQADTISYYLRMGRTYAVNELVPITSGSYSSGNLNLKGSLVSGVAKNDNPAEKNKYVYIPLAFRIMKYNSSNVLEPAKGENIWLSETVVEASDSERDGEVYKAIRMFTSGKKATTENDVTTLEPAKLLINPSSTSTQIGHTAVAGILDISGDGYYDSYVKNNKSYTLVYGETGGDSASENDFVPYTPQDGVSDSDLVNFNNVVFVSPHTIEASTFVAKYSPYLYHPVDQAAIDPLYQDYDTVMTVKPDNITSADLSGGKPICATDLTYGVADLDLTIWLEGWDHNVIDKENRHRFNLGLQFMISRL